MPFQHSISRQSEITRVSTEQASMQDTPKRMPDMKKLKHMTSYKASKRNKSTNMYSKRSKQRGEKRRQYNLLKGDIDMMTSNERNIEMNIQDDDSQEFSEILYAQADSMYPAEIQSRIQHQSL